MDEYNLKNKSTPYNTELVKNQTLDDLAFIVLSSGSTGEPKVFLFIIYFKYIKIIKYYKFFILF